MGYFFLFFTTEETEFSQRMGELYAVINDSPIIGSSSRLKHSVMPARTGGERSIIRFSFAEQSGSLEITIL